MNYSLLHLDSDEHVILELRKHWIVFAGSSLGLLLGAILPFAVFVFLRIFVPVVLQFSFSGNLSAFFLFLYSLWLLFLWLSFFMGWTKYFLDVWYVTDKRIIDVEQKRIFDREITNIRFDKIQNITVDVHGFIPTMLNYGTVKVQTAGEVNSEFVLTMIGEPDKVRQIIFGQYNKVGDTPGGPPVESTPQI